jgi:hypothetical protein
MGILIADHYLVALRGTAWTVMTLVVGTILLIHVLVLFLPGFITLLGSSLTPGLIWKAPSFIALLLVNLWSANMDYVLILPTLIACVCAVIGALVEVVLLWNSLRGCVAGTLPITCGTIDTVLVGILFGLAIALALAVGFTAVTLVDFSRGFMLRLELTSSNALREEYERLADEDD